jgi:hypothetical protein
LARGTAKYNQDWGSLAFYKNTYQPISNVINLAMTRTVDSGQVNWTTVSTESSGVRDYEVFAFTGALQATAPVYIRIDYTGTNTGGVSVTVGTTTDGAGTLGGLVVTKQILQTYTPTPSVTDTVWAASDGTSYFTFMYNLNATATGPDGVGIIVVERTRDADGAANGGGFHVWRWYGSTNVVSTFLGGWSKTFGAIGQPSVADYNVNLLVPDFYNNNSAFLGGNSYAFPVYTYTPPVTARGASKALMFAYQYDFPRGQAVTVTHFGEQMTFIPLADAVPLTLPVAQAANASTTKPLSPMLRWD